MNYIHPLLLADSAYHYLPFYGPIPLWANAAWPWLLLPLVIGVSVVYKAIRVREIRDLPRAAASITVWIIVGMAAAAGVLVAVVKIMQHMA